MYNVYTMNVYIHYSFETERVNKNIIVKEWLTHIKTCQSIL